MDQLKISFGLRIAIVIGVAVLFPATVYYGVATFADRPERPRSEYVGPNATKEAKQEAHDNWQTQMEVYKEQMEKFSLTLFWVAIPLGLVAIGLGMIHKLADISTGFIIAGIITIGEGHFGAWQYISDELRFASVLVGLALLLFVSYRRILAK